MYINRLYHKEQEIPMLLKMQREHGNCENEPTKDRNEHLFVNVFFRKCY